MDDGGDVAQGDIAWDLYFRVEPNLTKPQPSELVWVKLFVAAADDVPEKAGQEGTKVVKNDGRKKP